MLNKLTLTTALCALTLSNQAFADRYSSTPDDHAPIGVMGDHFHEEGEIMLSYRHSRMLMKGLKDGDSKITPSEVVSAGGNYGYLITPRRMDMDMQMIGVMYAPSNDVTLAFMGHYMEKDMELLRRDGAILNSKSKGFGDTTISALYRINDVVETNGDRNRLHATFGLSLPTGSSSEKDVIAGAERNLPYAMQLGSGTYDPIVGLTYANNSDAFSWGAQAQGKFRLGTNQQGYSLGEEFKVNSWFAKNLTDWVSASIRVEGTSKGSLDGQDRTVPTPLTNNIVTFDTNNYGGEMVEVGFGLNLFQGSGDLKGHRLAFEYTIPVYENLDGPQMSLSNTVWVGCQYAF